jgi:CHAT domain-containing protein
LRNKRMHDKYFYYFLIMSLGFLSWGTINYAEEEAPSNSQEELFIQETCKCLQDRINLSSPSGPKLFDHTPDPNRTGTCIDALMDQAKTFRSLGQYRRAYLKLTDALSIAEWMSDNTRILALKNALGAVLIEMRQWDQSEAILTEALTLAAKQQNLAASAAVLNNLGNLYASQNNHQKAQDCFQKGYALAREIGLTAEAAKLKANAAITAYAVGRYQDADAYNGMAIQLISQIKECREKAFLLITIGLTDEGISSHIPRSRDRLLRRAFDSYTLALRISRQRNDKRIESFALGYLGRLYELEQRPDEALRLTRQAAFLAQQLQAPELLYRWHWQTGRLMQAKGELNEAVRCYNQAVLTFESIRNEMASGLGNLSLLMGFRKTVGGMYYDLADAQLQLAGQVTSPDKSQDYMVRAREAIELFKTAEIVDYFRDQCLEQARTNIREIESLTSNTDTAIIYLIPLRDRTEVILSHASNLKRIRIPIPSEPLVSEVRRFRLCLENRTTHRYRKSAQRLYHWLIPPIEEALTGGETVTTLVFVPDGALRTIPMAALHDGNQFLIERYAVAVTPGLTLMAPRPFTANWHKVLLCGMTEPVAGFCPLTYVSTELDFIQKLSGGRQLIDNAFHLSQLEKEISTQPPQVLHIASHGQFNADPSKTFVLIHDGRLTLGELEMLIRPSQFRGAPVELLSLSACETAAGDDRAALGLAGVALKAGARSAMATLWFVNDEVSARLVTNFYENLYQHEDFSKAQALQKAQLSILQDPRYRHPCYWAPYLIIGNWL